MARLIHHRGASICFIPLQSILLKGTLSWLQVSIPLQVLVDSGTNNNFIDSDFFCSLNYPPRPFQNLRTWKTVDWSTSSFINWYLSCHSHCLHSAVPTTVTITPVPPKPVDLTSAPSNYHDHQEVFDKDRALSVPPHRPYDCCIDLLPGAPLLSSSLYNLSRPE